MSPRLAYILRQSFRNKFGVWITDAAITGTYTDRQGNEKKRYTTIGTLFQYDDGGLTLKLDSVPVGEGWNGFVSFYDIEERQNDVNPRRSEASASAAQTERFSADLDDEIPF